MTAPFSPGAPDTDLGALLLTIRKRSGSSQKLLARRGHCDQSTVSLVEHNKRPLTRELFSAYFELVREDPTMQRRLLLTASAAGAVGAVVGPLVDMDLTRKWEAATRVNTDWWHDHVAEVAAEFVTAPAGHMRTRLYIDLDTLTDLGMPERLRSEAAKLVCMYARVQNTTTGGTYWMNEAITMAQTGPDTATLGWVYGRAALEFSHGPNYTRAFDYARTAGDIADSVRDPLAQVGAFNALLGAAHAAVTAGQADRARTYWANAQYAYDRIDTDGEGDFGCTLERMAINASHLLSRLGDASAEDWTASTFGSDDDEGYQRYREIHQALRAHAVGDPSAGAMAQAVIDAMAPEDQWASLKRMAVAAGATLPEPPTTRLTLA